MSSVTVCLFTWSPELEHNRGVYARRTLEAAVTQLTATGHELRWHIADDGSADGHVVRLREIIAAAGYAWSETNGHRGGYGRSYNLASQVIHQQSDFVLCLEDDWELARPLDLGPLMDAMLESENKIRCVRLGYLGWTQQLRGWLESFAGQHFLLFDPSSSERHVFAGHPRIETRDFQRAVGEWPEGMAAGATEFEVCGRPEARLGVAWPLDLVKPAGDLFPHIGSETVGEVEPSAT